MNQMILKTKCNDVERISLHESIASVIAHFRRVWNTKKLAKELQKEKQLFEKYGGTPLQSIDDLK